MTRDAEAIALKPCPFCGGEAYHPTIGGIVAEEVWCKGCEIEMHNGDDGIPIAAASWNTRADAAERASAPSEGNVERVAEAIWNLLPLHTSGGFSLDQDERPKWKAGGNVFRQDEAYAYARAAIAAMNAERED